MIFLKPRSKIFGLTIGLIIVFCSSFIFCNTASANAVIDSLTKAIAHKEQIAKTLSKADTKTINAAKTKKASSPLFFKLAANYSLVVFYSSTCPHCQRFLPLLKQFATEYGFTVYPYTVTGASLPSYPYSLTFTPAVKQAFFQNLPLEVPTLFLVGNNDLKSYLMGQVK